MRKCVRDSAFALAAALILAAACAGSRAGNASAERSVPVSPHQGSAPFDLAGCANAAAGGAEFRPVCLGPAELARAGIDSVLLDGSGAGFAGASLSGSAPEFGDDPDSVFVADLAPSATAAPTPEISTAAMLTLGFAAAFWTARGRRRRALGPRSSLAIAAAR